MESLVTPNVQHVPTKQGRVGGLRCRGVHHACSRSRRWQPHTAAWGGALNGMRLARWPFQYPKRRHGSRTHCEAAAAEILDQEPKSDAVLGGNTFDIGLAVALAGCAFEAYNEPAGAEGYKEVALNKTTNTYVDRDFVEKNFAGLLFVNLHSAVNLAAKDIWGASDPYCTLNIGPSAYRTKAIMNTLNPTWNESFYLYIRDIDEQQLNIKVLDKDFITSDDVIGRVRVPLKDLCDGRAHALQPKLQDCNTDATLCMAVKFLPFTPELAGVAAEPEMGPPAPGSPLEHMPDAWRALATVSGIAAEHLFQMVCFIENHDTDTQLWIGRNTARRAAVVAFRGTEQVKVKDFLTDCRLAPATFNPERVSTPQDQLPHHSGGSMDTTDSDLPGPWSVVAGALKALERPPPAQQPPASAATKRGWQDAIGGAVQALKQTPKALHEQAKEVLARNNESAQEQLLVAQSKDEPWVHEGFLDAYDSVHVQVLATLEEVMDDGCDEPWQLLVTGHSLGGALATLCAYELAARRYRKVARPEVSMYNFGSPRVGNIPFVKDYNAMVPNSWRVFNPNDIVCQVPRVMGYAHVGQAVEIQPDGKFQVMTGGSKDVWGEGGDVMETLVQMAKKLRSEDEQHRAELDQLLEREMAILNSIINGSGLSEHMEDFYHAALAGLVHSTLEEDGSSIAKDALAAAVSEASGAIEGTAA